VAFIVKSLLGMERNAGRDSFLIPSTLSSKLSIKYTKLFSKWGVGEKETVGLLKELTCNGEKGVKNRK
jgi:hypothetical protein